MVYHMILNAVPHAINSVQLFSHFLLFMTPWTAACQASLSITNSQNLFKLMSIESVIPSNISSSVIPFSSCLQSFPASGIFPVSQLFVSGSQSIGASASVLNEYLGLISFRINWFDLLAVKGTLKNLLQHQSSKSINSLALSFLYGLNLTSIHSVRFSSIQSLSHV